VSAVHSHVSPFRVFPEPRLRPDWLVPGQIAAQEARWATVGGHGHVDAALGDQDLRDPYADAGDRA
jgi:hypothetical protein